MELGSGHCREWAQAVQGSAFFYYHHSDVLSAGQHLSDAFAQVNPLKKVPVLKDGDFTLTER